MRKPSEHLLGEANKPSTVMKSCAPSTHVASYFSLFEIIRCSSPLEFFWQNGWLTGKCLGN